MEFFAARGPFFCLAERPGPHRKSPQRPPTAGRDGYRGSGRILNSPLQPQPESPHRPLGQRVTRGDRSRDKCGLAPRSSAARSVRLRGISTTGGRRRVDGASNICRTDSLDSRICRTLRLRCKVRHPALFLLDRPRPVLFLALSKREWGADPHGGPTATPARRCTDKCLCSTQAPNPQWPSKTRMPCKALCAVFWSISPSFAHVVIVMEWSKNSNSATAGFLWAAPLSMNSTIR